MTVIQMLTKMRRDTTTYYQDLDGDGFGDDAVTESSCTMPEGFVDVGGDCDDNNVNAYDSTAVETCDGFDNNCDGNADEGVTTTYYADTDGDTYGDSNSAVEACGFLWAMLPMTQIV